MRLWPYFLYNYAMQFFRIIPELFKKDFSLALGLAVYNLLFIVGYIFWGWGVDETMFLFWFEAIILTIFIWLQLYAVNINKKGDIIVYTAVFAWQLIVILGVFYELNAEKFGLSIDETTGLGRMAGEIFFQMLLAVPALVPSMLLLIVNFFIDFVRKTYKTSSPTDVQRRTSVLFYSSLIHVYFLLVMITFFNVFFDKLGVGYGWLILVSVITVKTVADFSVASFEDDAFRGDLSREDFVFGKSASEKPRFVVWGKEYNPGLIFFTLAWFCLSAVFAVVHMSLLDEGFAEIGVSGLWGKVFYVVLIFGTYGILVVLFLIVFFNSKGRVIFISHDGKLCMRGFFKSFSFEISGIEKVSVNKGKKYGGYLHLLVTVKNIMEPKKFTADAFKPDEVKELLERLGEIDKHVRLVGMGKFDSDVSV